MHGKGWEQCPIKRKFSAASRSRLQAALRTPDGQKAARIISDRHAADLERAAQAAQRGDMGEAARLAQQLMQSPEGTQLAHKLRQIFSK